MRTLLTILLVLSLNSCGRDDSATIAAGINPDGTPSTTVKGEKGDKGEKGEKGEQGTPGTNGTMVSGNQWYDPITTKMWVMTTIITSTVGWTNSQSACGGAYRMPTPTEVQLALTHGMKACAQALTNAPAQIIANDGQSYNVSTGALNNTGLGAQFCVMN